MYMVCAVRGLSFMETINDDPVQNCACSMYVSSVPVNELFVVVASFHCIKLVRLNK